MIAVIRIVIVSLFFLALPINAIEFGTNLASVGEVRRDGANVDYGVYWVGAWMDKYGWYGYEKALEEAKLQNVTPVIVWFYWGDQISPENIYSQGIYDPIHDVTKSRERWFSMANELADITKSHMGDREVVIIVENEFNKNGIENYPEFNDDLISQGSIFRSKLNATLVVGFGNWNLAGWKSFSRTVDSYDIVGFQFLKASTKNSVEEFTNAVDSINETIRHINTTFNRSSIIYDFAVSSYPEPQYENQQKDILESVLVNSDDFQRNGLRLMIYREIIDNIDMSEDEYFGKAERHWGLKRIDGSKKSSYAIFTSYTNTQKIITVQSYPEEEAEPESKQIENKPYVAEPIRHIIPIPQIITINERGAISKAVFLESNWVTLKDPAFAVEMRPNRFVEFVYKLLSR